ncbi:MAG: phytanoyl-CoA dioxygenase family protein [Chthonomonadetes bacterium]|nr:phytanoyl-CoA dioxygenase family protein [Chthonomonadetes bacterium]
MQARKLTPAELKHYEEQGYLVYGKILTDEELHELRTYVDDLIASLPPGRRPEGLDHPHFDDPYLMKWCQHPRILDVVEQIIGPNIVLFSSHFIAKPGGDGLPVPWHQDATYWPLSPMKVVTVWLAVDDSDAENGCMQVIPGTHRMGAVQHHRVDDPSRYVLDLETEVDESKAVDIVLKAGEMSLHDAWLLHGSKANHSPRRRCGYTMRYMPTEVVLDRTKWPDWKLWLVRGEDREGNNRYENAG